MAADFVPPGDFLDDQEFEEVYEVTFPAWIKIEKSKIEYIQDNVMFEDDLSTTERHIHYVDNGRSQNFVYNPSVINNEGQFINTFTRFDLTEREHALLNTLTTEYIKENADNYIYNVVTLGGGTVPLEVTEVGFKAQIVINGDFITSIQDVGHVRYIGIHQEEFSYNTQSGYFDDALYMGYINPQVLLKLNMICNRFIFEQSQLMEGGLRSGMKGGSRVPRKQRKRKSKSKRSKKSKTKKGKSFKGRRKSGGK